MYKRALAGQEKALDLGDPRTLFVANDLGKLYHGSGQIYKAEKMWKRALAGYEKVLVPHHHIFHASCLIQAHSTLARASLGKQRRYFVARCQDTSNSLKAMIRV